MTDNVTQEENQAKWAAGELADKFGAERLGCTHPKNHTYDGRILEPSQILALIRHVEATAEAKHTTTITAMSAQHREEVEAIRNECVALSAEWEEISKKRSAQKAALDAEIESLRDKCAMLADTLKELLDGVVPEANEKGAGGFLLARISDARAVLAAPDVEAWKNKHRAEVIEEVRRNMRHLATSTECHQALDRMVMAGQQPGSTT